MSTPAVVVSFVVFGFRTLVTGFAKSAVKVLVSGAVV